MLYKTLRLNYLTTREASHFLYSEYGMRLMPDTLRTKAKNGSGPVAQYIGSHLAFPVKGLAAWAEAQIRPATAPRKVLELEASDVD